MNNHSRAICGVKNGTSFFDVLEHEYNPETSECIPFAVSAPFMLKFVSYFSCALASTCACSVLIASAWLVSLLFSKTRKSHIGNGKGNCHMIKLYSCFCFFGFTGSLLVAVSTSKRIYFVVPLDTFGGATNAVFFATGIIFNAVAIFTYPLTFKHIRVSSVVVPIVSLPSAPRTMGFLLLYTLIFFVSTTLSLATGLIADTFSYIRLVVAWGLPLKALGLCVPNLLRPVLRSINGILSNRNDRSIADMDYQSKNEKKLHMIPEIAGKDSKRLLPSGSFNKKTTINRKAIEHARSSIYKLQIMFQILPILATFITIVFTYTPLIYEPYVILTFQLFYVCTQLGFLLFLALLVYHSLRSEVGRASRSTTTVCMESTVMDMHTIGGNPNSVAASHAVAQNHVKAANQNNEFY